MFKAIAAAHGAAAVATVETEKAGFVIALYGNFCFGKQLAQFIKGAHIASGVASRGFSDRALVNKGQL